MLILAYLAVIIPSIVGLGAIAFIVYTFWEEIIWPLLVIVGGVVIIWGLLFSLDWGINYLKEHHKNKQILEFQS